MSYTIEYGRKVYWWPDGFDRREKNYLLLICQGDNNVWDADLKRRSRDWEVIACGWEYQLWEKIGERAGYTEGGSLQRGVGFGIQRISIEEYIALYRKAIKDARAIERIFNDFLRIDFIIKKKEVISNKYEAEAVNKAFDRFRFKHIGKDYYHEDIEEYSYTVTNVEDLLYCLLELPRGRYASDLYTSFYFESKKTRRLRR